ncbi:MAG TPA: helix-hairpin-helix domain-containing protein [Pyrinomonadaceae bacterium]|nr:helix-hairpin-helix domain-containing protein [Pyrinomonadaceae bacterium]
MQKQRQTISTNKTFNLETAINLNTASVEEIEKLPGVGEDLARRIVEYRQINGRFRRPEELLLLRGVGEKKFQRVRPFIKTE